FGNYIFNLDFPSFLPKLYRNHREVSRYHHLVKEGNRIKAMVGSFPLGLTVCQSFLKGRGIGTVSVHKYSRNLGYMRYLMDRAIAEMKAEGCDFAVLGGQRQRYEYWGFTPCGMTLKLNFNSSNIKHCHIETEEDYKFVEYDNAAVGDLGRAVSLHDLQPVHAVREKGSFIEITKSWNSRVLFIYKKDEFTGYLSASDNGEEIKEILLTNPDETDKVIAAYMNSFNLKNTRVVLPMHRSKEFMQLSRFCEYYSINSSANIYIINYMSIIKAFMNLKNTFYPLKEGILVLNIEEKGRYKIEVKDGTVRVEETELPYDISLSHLDASALLFSHSTFVNSAYNFTDPLVKAWFPLPLFYPELDNV
ncbi:MAG: GNAT family N-acetyltransferase, partial [Bacillota bacterium]|nr:GNAT family N-acetyltransferase [Bacillota bacterium]